MGNMLTGITNYLWTQSWQIAVLAMIIAAVSLVLKNKSAHVRYLLWMIVLAKCLIPPLVTIPLAILPGSRGMEPVLTTPVEMPAVTIEAVDTAESDSAIALPLVPVARPTIVERLAEVTVYQWVVFVWIIGAGLFALIAVIKAFRVNRWLSKERKLLSAGLQAEIEELLAGLGIEPFPRVWLVDDIGQPFVWGLVRGSIYLPADFTGVDNAEHRRGVLGHELSHILRFDAAVNLLQIIAQGVFWFHPFVWWANRKIRAEREKCCDEMAIARFGTAAKDYSRAIVDTLLVERKSAIPVPSLAVAGPVKNIEDRIKTIMESGKRFYKRPSLIAAIVVLVLAGITVPTTIALTAQKGDKANVQVEADEEAKVKRRLESAKKLSDLGKALLLYANDHEEKYPDTLEGLKPYIQKEQDFQWILENVKYIGEGKSADAPPDAILAYDKTLLEEGEGTNVLFNDGHVRFEKPERLERLGVKLSEETKAEIRIEGRFLFVSVDTNEVKDFFEEEKLEFPSGAEEPNYTSVLNAEQADRLLELTQASADSKVLAAPNVVVFDGESATVRTQKTITYEYIDPDATSTQPEQKELPIGTIIQVAPTLQADGREILLELDFEHINFLGFEDGLPQTEITRIRSRAVVPDGQTLLLGGQKITDEDEQGVIKMLLFLVKAEKVEQKSETQF